VTFVTRMTNLKLVDRYHRLMHLSIARQGRRGRQFPAAGEPGNRRSSYVPKYV
jgi:hypothetical protein